jgi:hypothetical protein
LLGLLGLGVSGVASAACEAPYSKQDLLGHVQSANGALSVGADEDLAAAAKGLEAGLPCMEETLQPQVLATVYRLVGMGLFHGGEPDKAALWLRTSLELDPTHVWDIQDVPPGSEAAVFWEAQEPYKAADAVAVEGKSFAEGLTIVLDGKTITRPRATTDRVHLVQVVEDGRVVRGQLFVGVNFPEDLLVDGEDPNLGTVPVAEGDDDPKKPRRDRELAGGYNESDTVVLLRERPPAKIPLLAVGVGSVAIAGGLYGASYATHASFEGAGTEADINSAASMTNGLVIASGAALVVGAGLGTWGLLLSAP